MDGKGNNREAGRVHPSFSQRSVDHALPLKEGKDIGGREMSFRISGFRNDNDEGRIWIGDASDQMVTANQGCSRVLPMPVVKRLEATMDHAIACLHAGSYSRFYVFSLSRTVGEGAKN